VSVLAAYVVGRATPPGALYMHVFQLVSSVAFIGYSVALWQMSIWYRRSWNTTIKATVDGLIYALLTAGVFGWLWPK
jgi:sulfite exporter TauE/SafE